MSIRDRRIASEWSFLEQLAGFNPDSLSTLHRTDTADGTAFRFMLALTPAFSGLPPRLKVFERHSVTLLLPHFFPAVPMEAFVKTPVFHPNIHPASGFVCLWDSFSPGDSVLEAISKLQRVLTWELFNDSGEHVMQPDALIWSHQLDIPLRYVRVRIPPELESECNFRTSPRPRRKRLSDCK